MDQDQHLAAFTSMAQEQYSKASPIGSLQASFMNTAEIQVMEEQHLAVSRPVAEEQHCKSSSTESSDRSSDWTSIDSTPRSEQENVRVFPGNKVREFKRVQLLEKIGQGGQGCIHNAKFFFEFNYELEAGYVHRREKNITFVDVAGRDEPIFAAKIFNGKVRDNHFGQWPEELFKVNALCRHICKFHGYSIYNPVNGGSKFCLIMDKYDCSLRDSIDKHMKTGTYEGRPFHGGVALSVIIKIAIGMAYLHQLNIIHRDLKAANILVSNIGDGDDTPADIFIADFDVASTVKGTLFWRAPEILQVLKDRVKGSELKTLDFTTKSDVYSFGMTCYEILTGVTKPFEEIGATDYDVVLSGKRPELPSNLNHKMKDLLARCWQHDPDARPSFKEIVSELQGFVAGDALLMELFTLGDAYGGVDEFDLESNLVKLKQLAHVLAEKYNHGSCVLTDTTEDFVVLAFQYIDALEEFKAQFGLESFREHPSLPPLQVMSRTRLYYKIIEKGDMFSAACPLVIPEYGILSMLKIAFIRLPDTSQSMSTNKSVDIEWSLTEEEWALVFEAAAANNKELQRQHQLDYANRHAVCHKVLMDKKWGIINDSGQPCNFCRDLPFYARGPPHVLTFQLYEDKYNIFKSLFTFLVRNSRILLNWPLKVLYR